MVWVPHMLAGAVIMVLLGPANIGLALILALISHCVFDALPHWEYEHCVGLTKKQALKVSWKMTIDLSLGILLIYLFSRENLLLPLAGGFLAIFPDLNYAFNIFFPNRISEFLEKTHDKFDFNKFDIPSNIKIPAFWGIITQILVIIISAYLLLSQTRL